jgi:hypothetical protein
MDLEFVLHLEVGLVNILLYQCFGWTCILKISGAFGLSSSSDYVNLPSEALIFVLKCKNIQPEYMTIDSSSEYRILY